MSIIANPDCTNGKHRSCTGVGWDDELDEYAPCPCTCHPKPSAPAPRKVEARTLSGADLGKMNTGPGFIGGRLQVIRHAANQRVGIALGEKANFFEAEVVNLAPSSLVNIAECPQ